MSSTPSQQPVQVEQEWHYTTANGEQRGPVTASQLQQLCQNGSITSSSQVWSDGMDEWVPASQVEGLELNQSETVHAPQINVSSGGINLAPTISARPASATMTSSSTSGGSTKWIVGAIIVVLVGLGIFLINPKEEAIDNTQAIKTYQDANQRLTAGSDQAVFGNSKDALKIGTQFIHNVNPPPAPSPVSPQENQQEPEADPDTNADNRPDTETNTPVATAPDPAVNDPSNATPPAPKLTRKKLTLSLHCQTKQNKDQQWVALLVKVPGWSKFDSATRKQHTQQFWELAQQALANTPYNKPTTQLAVAIRGSQDYTRILTGHPQGKPNETLAQDMNSRQSDNQPTPSLLPYFSREAAESNPRQ